MMSCKVVIRLKKVLRWIGVVVLILIIIGGGWYGLRHFGAMRSNQTTHRSTKVVKKKVHLVALGDSLTYGQGDQQNNGGYVGLIKPKLEKKFHNTVTTVNYGVSGDRSDQILQRVNKQSAIRRDLKQADVIVMTVGGNDLMQTLQKNLMVNSSQKFHVAIDQAGTTYQTKLKRLLSTVRQQNSHAPIFVFSIYNPVYAYFPQVDSINSAILQWNRLTKGTIHHYRPAYFVDINHLMSYGQYRTTTQRRRLIRDSEKTNSSSVSQKQIISIMNHGNHNLNEYISTTDNFHPNHLGYKKMTAKLYQMMLKHDQFEYRKR